MNFLDSTLARPEENLACDEALLDACEEQGAEEVLRFWEPKEFFVVLGYANQAQREVDLEFCAANGIPVLRRCTGGGTVLQGPGGLNYTLVLRIGEKPELRSISATNEFVLRRHEAALRKVLDKQVVWCGQTDLAIGGRKFSGNAQRRKRSFLIFHGSFLLDFDLEKIAKALPMPSKEPEYRGGRAHREFLMNLGVGAEMVKKALWEAWEVQGVRAGVPRARVEELVRRKYGREEWNLGRGGKNDE
jgi:lipoate-protein ligase A